MAALSSALRSSCGAALAPASASGAAASSSSVPTAFCPRLTSARSAFEGRPVALPATSACNWRRVQRQAAPRATLAALTDEAGTREVFADEVKGLLEDGWKIVDIRDETQFQRSHIKGSDNVPLFVKDNGLDPTTLAKRAMHQAMVGTLYGNEFTKPNEEFAASLEKKYGKDAKLLLVDQSGLRSGAAVTKLEKTGFQNLAFLSKGLKAVKPGVLEKEGPRELSAAGEAGIARFTPQISAVFGTILITLIIIIQLFPEETSPTLKVIFENAKANVERMNGGPLN